jgi:hypothetical protein
MHAVITLIVLIAFIVTTVNAVAAWTGVANDLGVM